ncbi:hypothetical protein CSB11_01505 [Candidatus Campbellbacteria bacterium]|nr:MAG: hypothetical protein CSB11_01505 [Candidatus Campbellbacteria bacterium]
MEKIDTTNITKTVENFASEKTGLSPVWIAVITVALVFVVWVVKVYNSLVQKRIRTKDAWSGIDIQIKNRYDLVPNLVNTVKGYASHEKETLERVLEARSKATAIKIDAANVTKEQMAMFAGAQGELTAGLGKLMAIAENYPELKANENFLELQRTLEDLEDKIAAARRFYNGTVSDYNEQVKMFPSNIIAKIFNFTQREFFEVAEEEKKNPEVKFD